MPGIVDALWMVELLAGRAAAAMVDFILAGPTAGYLAGRRRTPGDPFVLVTSREYSQRLAMAARIAARPAAPRGVRGLTGLVWSGTLYSWRVAVLEDPAVTGPRGERRVFHASEVARRSGVAVVNERPVRLAPRDLDEALESTGLYSAAWL